MAQSAPAPSQREIREQLLLVASNIDQQRVSMVRDAPCPEMATQAGWLCAQQRARHAVGGGVPHRGADQPPARGAPSQCGV